MNYFRVAFIVASM